MAQHLSPWIATAPPSGLPPSELPRDADVAVLGAGVVGLTTAVLLQWAGHRVVVVEAGRVGRGVTGHSTVKATVAQGSVLTRISQRLGDDAARVYAQANAAGLRRIRSLADELDVECDLATGPHVVYARGPESVDAVRTEARIAAACGLAVEETDAAPLPFEVAAAASFPDQVSLHPVRYLLGLARAVVDAGGAVVEGVRATGARDDDPCVVSTTAGELRAGHVVVATHVPFLDRGLHFTKLAHHRAYGVASVLPDGVDVGMTISVDEPTRSTRTVEVDGERLAVVVGEGHHVGEDGDTSRRWRALADWAAQHLGTGPVRYTWSTQDASTPDGLPYVGRLTPGTDRLLLATGFAGWGMTNGTAAAEVLADQVEGRVNPWADALDARRFNLSRTAGPLAAQNARVAAHAVGDRLRHLAAGRPEDLAPGQAAVLRVGARHLACYRDDDGGLHVVAARCTHLGCLVAWNDGERSWDCPCHASRFDHTGAVLQGPAVRPLPPASRYA